MQCLLHPISSGYPTRPFAEQWLEITTLHCRRASQTFQKASTCHSIHEHKPYSDSEPWSIKVSIGPLRWGSQSQTYKLSTQPLLIWSFIFPIMLSMFRSLQRLTTKKSLSEREGWSKDNRDAYAQQLVLGMNKDSRREPKWLLGFVDRCKGAERRSFKQVFGKDRLGRREQGKRVETFKRTRVLQVAASDRTGVAKSVGWSCTTSCHTAIYKMILCLENSSLMGKTPRPFVAFKAKPSVYWTWASGIHKHGWWQGKQQMLPSGQSLALFTVPGSLDAQI